ncbi:MAG: hypothetical protein Q8S15_01870 [Erysipelotrichaceae bacterium]|nr:hypothetical protein [Erysipelotrichaceae bacterium]MDP3304812.1 hypothetical protein [Erysipelotrichaceae bacterium]
MKYFEDAFKFVTKNYLILIPFFIVALVPAILVMGSTPTTADVDAILRDFQQYPGYFLDNPEVFIEALRTAGVGNSASSGSIAMILNFMAIPMTAGLVKLGLNRGSVSINDFALALSSNIGKYFRYFLGGILFGLVAVIAIILYVVALISLLTTMSESGVIVVILGFILLSVIAIAISLFLSFWFTAMVLDDLGVMAALKKSFAIAKRSFWTLFGIGLLLAIAEGIVGGILGFFAFIPLLPTVLISILSAFIAVVHMAFLFLIYRSYQPSSRIETEEVNVIY